MKPLTNKVPKNILEPILQKYLISHSSRKLNYLYWNVTDQKDMTLNFVNLSGKELNRINNSDLVYRIVRVKNAEDWAILAAFINSTIIDPDDSKAAYVIRVDYLMTYLKGLNFDTDQIILTRGSFGTLFCHNDDDAKRKPICTVDTDIQSLYLIDRLYTKYRKMLYSDSQDWNIKDITSDYLNDPKFKYIITELNVTVPTTDALDVVSRKFIGECKARDNNSKLEQIFVKNGLSTVVSRLTCSDINIITVRVYIQVFLKKYSKKGKRNGGE